jgi:deazaflavin-dependent oxidoreductase (nitroreductase family)
MNQQLQRDPAEQHPILRWFYRGWRPTAIGRQVNRLAAWYSGSRWSPTHMAMLEVRGRTSGTLRHSPVVIATVDGHDYLVSILGNGSEWVKNVDAAHGAAVIRHGHDRAVHLALVPASMRAPILSEYVRAATSGRHHFPVPVGAPLSEFASIAEWYPVYRIDPPRTAPN